MPKILKTVLSEIRGNFVYQVITWIAGGGLLTAITVFVRAIHNHPFEWHFAISVFGLSALAVAIVMTLAARRSQPQPHQTASALVNTSANIAVAVKSVEDFYKLGYGGPFADELEAHFEGLAVYHTNPKDRERFLIRALAAGAVSYIHESTWNDIWKSQIDALKHMNSNGAVVATELTPFYDAAATAYPGVFGGYSFEGWLRFMKGQTLVRQDGNILQITVRGKDFLKYIVLEGKREDWKKY